MQGYLVNESNSETTFAVIKGVKLAYESKDLGNLVAETVKDEFCYESVKAKFIHDFRNRLDFTCDCVTQDGDEEIREISLTKTAIYS